MDVSRRQKLQNQLRQFLKDFRNINNLSAEQAAEHIEVEIATYRTLEGRKPSNRVISVLEYLDKIASLKKLSLTAFISFLERSQRTESGSNEMKRTLYQWERDLLEKFDFVDIPLRNRFMRSFMSKSNQDVKATLACLTQIASMSDSKRIALFNLVKEMEHDT